MSLQREAALLNLVSPGDTTLSAGEVAGVDPDAGTAAARRALGPG